MEIDNTSSLQDKPIQNQTLLISENNNIEIDLSKTPNPKGKLPQNNKPSYSKALTKDLQHQTTSNKSNKPKANLVYDWLANFLITDEMKPNTKL